MRMRYGGGRPIQVRGPATGVEYRFSGLERLQLVDPRDAVALVRNPLFRVEGIVEVSDHSLTAKREDGAVRE
jgi:hypothetical protein